MSDATTVGWQTTGIMRTHFFKLELYQAPTSGDAVLAERRL
jgi:hypothetical protein